MITTEKLSSTSIMLTHVSGIVAGKRIDGPGMADGIAPGSKLAFMDIGDSTGSLVLPQDEYLLETGSPIAKIHSASWGSEFTFYTTQARNFNQHMYDNDEFLILVAAGNSGAGDAPSTVGSPATGKNIIAVGAHHNTDSSQPKGGLGPSYIADFSSRGRAHKAGHFSRGQSCSFRRRPSLHHWRMRSFEWENPRRRFKGRWSPVASEDAYGNACC